VSDIDSSYCLLEIWLRYSDGNPEVTEHGQSPSRPTLVGSALGRALSIPVYFKLNTASVIRPVTVATLSKA
jgi:hypothetical protein